LTGIWSIQNGGKAESLLFCETFANGERERDNKWWRMSTFIRVRRGGLWKEWRKQEREKILLHINTRVGFSWAMSHSYMDRSCFLSKEKTGWLFSISSSQVREEEDARAPSSSTCIKLPKILPVDSNFLTSVRTAHLLYDTRCRALLFSSPTCPFKPVVVLVNTFAHHLTSSTNCIFWKKKRRRIPVTDTLFFKK
jgi:hypothetical protein